MPIMNRLYQVTTEILHTLKQPMDSADDREQMIASLNQLLEKRSAIIRQVQPPYTEESLAIGKKVVELDQEIQAKMNELFRFVQDDLKKLKQKKDTNIAYMNPYKHMKTVDGMYLDNKL